MASGLAQRLKKLEKSATPAKTLSAVFHELSNEQLKTYVHQQNSLDAKSISDLFSWDIERANTFLNDLERSIIPKQYARLKTEQLISFILSASSQ